MRAAEAGSGASSWELMQRAGAGCAEWVWRVAAGRAVTILCGPGNNGGDGYVVAEILRARGLEVAVVAPRPPTSEPACEARARFKGAVAPGLAGARKGVLVDALFGFGLSRPLADPFANLLQEALATHCYSIAIDLPSGVDADTGADLGHQGPRDLTLALGAWKRAHFLMPASAAMGARRLVDIGVAPPAGSDRAAERPRLRPPAADSHKYRRGLLAIVAGAMPGAALLAAEAALRSGAGYVKLLGAAFGPAIPAELVAEPGAVEDRGSGVTRAPAPASRRCWTAPFPRSSTATRSICSIGMRSRAWPPLACS
jgi:ADP-dependent NAD(P)H-hydrate dehydratase / NAD(P)H-hydrate epimerase